MIGVLCSWRCLVNNSSRIQVKLDQNQSQTSEKSVQQNGLDFNWSFPTDLKFSQFDDVEPVVTTFDNLAIESKQPVSARGVLARIAIPVVIAILIGSLLGYSSLNLIKNQLSSDKQPPSSVAAVATSSNDAFLEKNVKVSFVQSGVFSTKESATTTAKELPNGTPHLVLKLDQKYYLFVGVASSIEQAKALAQGFKTASGTAYWKDVQINGKSTERFRGQQLEQLKVLQSNIQVMIAAVGAERMSTPLMEWHTDDVTGTEKGKLGQLIQLNDEIISSFRAYSKSRTTEKLAETEQKILDFLKIYQSL